MNEQQIDEVVRGIEKRLRTYKFIHLNIARRVFQLLGSDERVDAAICALHDRIWDVDYNRHLNPKLIGFYHLFCTLIGSFCEDLRDEINQFVPEYLNTDDQYSLVGDAIMLSVGEFLSNGRDLLSVKDLNSSISLFNDFSDDLKRQIVAEIRTVMYQTMRDKTIC